ncbi:Endonuclease-reverse transcriptase [Operophtera brumata]|uniref:Endonuclease-reverse transcriptase n=1 Tax=Operophtera brumata TaxID=104452 RepID=A0A0L7L5T7_OPEBR|nr:Endonuclease-reverse transcriptase [Operophtera brumata]
MQRQEKLRTYIQKFGAVKKAYKELKNKKEWTESLKNGSGVKITSRPAIINEVTNYYKDLYANREKEVVVENENERITFTKHPIAIH